MTKLPIFNANQDLRRELRRGTGTRDSETAIPDATTVEDAVLGHFKTQQLANGGHVAISTNNVGTLDDKTHFPIEDEIDEATFDTDANDVAEETQDATFSCCNSSTICEQEKEYESVQEALQVSKVAGP